MEKQQTWTEFKAVLSTKKLFPQYDIQNQYYHIWTEEGTVFYVCDIEIEDPASEEQIDFEDNYKDDCNKAIKVVDNEGRIFYRAESKPTTMTTYFTSKGDTPTEIGNGEELIFDFNNTDNDIANPPSGFKQKQVCCTFIDTVRLKEGTVYWENVPFGSSIDLCIGVPNNAYYYKNDGTYTQNTTGELLMIAKFVNDSPMMGSCPMGDEMNTETCSNDIPAGTIFGFKVTVPSTVTDTDNCHGVVVMELYRERTVILS